jgi:hypothetical protein
MGHVAFLTVFVPEGVAKQKFKPAIADERVALEIQKYVPTLGSCSLARPNPGTGFSGS